MSSELVLRIVSDKSLAQLKADLLKASGDRYGQAQVLKSALHAAAAGAMNLSLIIDVDPVKASGTATLVSTIATDTITVDGVLLTCVASGANGTTQFNVGLSDTATAVNLAATVNANTTLDGRVTATSALGVVTIQADNYGEDGNSISLTSAGGTITVGAALTGGDNGTPRTNNFGR